MDRGGRKPLIDRLGNAEVDDLGNGRSFVHGDQHVRRLEIAMDDTLLMRVLDGLTNFDEQLQSIPSRQVGTIAVFSDRNTLDQLHDEERPSVPRRAGVEYASDLRMVHQRQGLSLRLEASDHFARIHPRLEDLERDEPTDRLELFRAKHDSETSFANRLQQLVPSGDDFARRVRLIGSVARFDENGLSSDLCGDWILSFRSVAVAGKVRINLSLDFAAQRVASCTGGVHKTSPFARLGNRDGIRDDLFDRFGIGHTQELRISFGTDPYHSMSGSALLLRGFANLEY